MARHPSGMAREGGVDRSVRVSVPELLAEQAGALLMDVLGPFEEQRGRGRERQEGRVTLVFYPPAAGPSSRKELLRLLPPLFGKPGALEVDTADVSRDWVDGWREHFRPIIVGAVRIRPPWEPAAPANPLALAEPPASANPLALAEPALMDVVINPGLGFGTGLHPTTRGTLLLLQEGTSLDMRGPRAALRHPASARAGAALRHSVSGRGPLVDVGTGSGILAIAAAKLGWAPVIALDSDPVALVSARENVAANRVQEIVEICEVDIAGAPGRWFHGATVLANVTLEAVSVLIRRLAHATARPRRVVASGILAGSQEEQLMLIAHESGFSAGRRLYEEEWVSLELLPDRSQG